MSATRSGGPNRLPPMEWKFFLGACFLTGALLVPHAGIMPVVEGMGLAALILGVWSRFGRGSSR
jgi:hypothetical protein